MDYHLGILLTCRAVEEQLPPIGAIREVGVQAEKTDGDGLALHGGDLMLFHRLCRCRDSG